MENKLGSYYAEVMNTIAGYVPEIRAIPKDALSSDATYYQNNPITVKPFDKIDFSPLYSARLKAVFEKYSNLRKPLCGNNALSDCLSPGAALYLALVMLHNFFLLLKQDKDVEEVYGATFTLTGRRHTLKFRYMQYGQRKLLDVGRISWPEMYSTSDDSNFISDFKKALSTILSIEPDESTGETIWRIPEE